MRDQGVVGFNLVVCPLAVLGNWELEFKRFAPSMPILKYYGDKNYRKELREEMKRLAKGDPKYQPTIITTYSFARDESNLLARATARDAAQFKYQVLVIDEAQNIKSAATK